MDLIKKNIHMNKLKCKSSLQMTLDNDFNVPDVKPDIEHLVKEQGDIRISDVKAMNGKLIVKGILLFNVIYISDDHSRPVYNLSGEIPFDEVINMEEGCSDDDVTVRWDLEDLTTGVINSRKLSVKALVRLNVTVEDIYDQETAIGVESKDDVRYMNKVFPITGIGVSKKDTYRVKDEIHLPSNKANIFDIIFHEVDLRNFECRLLDNKFTIKGELPIFFMYIGEGEENSLEYYETEIPFNGMVDCSGCSEDMIDNITCSILNKSLEIKPDSDGEQRIVDVEVVLDLDIKAYQEDEVEAISDVYSPRKECIPTYRDAVYENLLVKNSSKSRIIDRIRVNENRPEMLLICHAGGSVNIDEITIVEEGIEVDGVIDVSLLYISSDDAQPLNSLKGVLPFTQLIEVKGINRNCVYDIKPALEQMSVIMLDSDEIEVKAVLSLSAIVFEKVTERIMVDLDSQEIDLDKLQAMPSITGYIVKPNETLWDIAKKFYTTMEALQEMNDLDSTMVHPGDKILVLKQMDEVF